MAFCNEPHYILEDIGEYKGMTFEQLVSAAQKSEALSVDSSWGQGRTLFGGMSAALAFAHIRPNVSQPRPLRALTVNIPVIELPSLGTNQRLSYMKGLTPEFVQHFEYAHTEAKIYNADGVLLALSRQLIAIYD